MTRLLLLICLATSAGVHAALAAGHGRAFYLAAALLTVAAAAVALLPGRPAAAYAGLLLAGLLGAYAHEHGAALDTIGAVTKAVEAAGLLLAARLALAPTERQERRVLTLLAAGMIAVFAAAATPSDAHEHPPGGAVHGH